MTLNSYKPDLAAMTDSAIVKSLCESIKQMRLNRNMSQAELAKRSGINRVTISRMESGRAATLLTVVQILRALDKLGTLETFRQEPEISPIQMLKIQEHQRKKAYGARKRKPAVGNKGQA